MTELVLYQKAQVLMGMLEDTNESMMPGWKKKAVYDLLEKAQETLTLADRRKDARRILNGR